MGDNKEASAECFGAFAHALGLRETSAAQLLAMLLCKAMPLSDYMERMDVGYGAIDESKSPVWSAAHTLLKCTARETARLRDAGTCKPT